MSVLVCDNISFNKNKKYGIDNFSYNFLDNKIYAIVGKSDSCQKQLLNLICAKEKPTSGACYLDGELLLNNSKINKRICYISNKTSFPGFLRVIDIFRLMRDNYPNWDNYYAFELANYFSIKHTSTFSTLKDNQKSLLINIIALASKANITVLDNPVDKADLKSRYDFFNFLYSHQEAYPRTFIISTTFIDEIDFLVNNVLLIDKGKLIANFTIQEMKENFRYLTGKTEVLKSLIGGVKVIGIESRGKTLRICIHQKLTKDEARKYQKYLIKVTEVPIQKILIHLINIREKKEEYL